MGLQLRVRHALGTRMVEVDERGPDRPLRIGRSADCDVQIPSGTVAPTHCLLYAQDGQWAVAPASESAAVAINGQGIAEPAFVNLGDVIWLAGNAGSIELDPLGTARRILAAASASMRPSAPTEPQPHEAAAEYPAAEEELPPQVAAQAPAAESDGFATNDDDEQWSLDTAAEAPQDQQPAAQTPRQQQRPARSRQRPNHNAIIAGIVIGAVAIVIVILVVVMNRQGDESRSQSTAEPKKERTDFGEVDTGPRNKFKSIFDEDPSKSKPPPKKIEAPRPAPQPQPQSNNGDDDNNGANPPRPTPTDPRMLTEDWKRVEEAHISRKYGVALWNYSDYRKLHPGEFEDKLKEYADQALDMLWWTRIKQLCNLRDRYVTQLTDMDRQIGNEDNPEEKAKLVKERTRVESMRQLQVDASRRTTASRGRSHPTSSIPTIWTNCGRSGIRPNMRSGAGRPPTTRQDTRGRSPGARAWIDHRVGEGCVAGAPPRCSRAVVPAGVEARQFGPSPRQLHAKLIIIKRQDDDVTSRPVGNERHSQIGDIPIEVDRKLLGRAPARRAAENAGGRRLAPDHVGHGPKLSQSRSRFAIAPGENGLDEQHDRNSRAHQRQRPATVQDETHNDEHQSNGSKTQRQRDGKPRLALGGFEHARGRHQRNANPRAGDNRPVCQRRKLLPQRAGRPLPRMYEHRVGGQHSGRAEHRQEKSFLAVAQKLMMKMGTTMRNSRKTRRGPPVGRSSSRVSRLGSM